MYFTVLLCNIHCISDHHVYVLNTFPFHLSIIPQQSWGEIEAEIKKGGVVHNKEQIILNTLIK